MSQEKDIHEVLKNYWGYSDFRPLQEDIIRSVIDGQDTLALLPTGGGKSICFQVPALALKGVCIVITPLIALMKDQVDHLKTRGIKAAAVYSGMTARQIDITLENAARGELKFLYCSPERLQTEMFRQRIQRMDVNILAVDESHCISQWGYDFRPPYLKIAEIRPLIPDAPALALTATATPEVVKDIQDKLHFPRENVFQKSFERKNLTYVVQHEEDKLNRLMRVITRIHGTGIVYVRNRKKTREIAQWLKSQNITANYYHAGLDQKTRERRQKEWMEGITRVIVSTNAFGMGIDKPNVRFVVHLDLPDNIEAYFQEAGRAGRDQNQAWAVLLYNNSDLIDAERFFEFAYPPLDIIKTIYNALGNYFQIPVGTGMNTSYVFDIYDFSKANNFNAVVVFNALSFLEKEGYILVSDALRKSSKVHFIMNRTELYKFQVREAYYDPFIKIMLRSYPGMFSDYIAINETEIASRARITVDKTRKILERLKQMNILDYVPRSENPHLVFSMHRQALNDLNISKKNYQERKEAASNRLKAIKKYVISQTRCRSQLLLEYFGEKDTIRCGKCDVCRKRNKLNLSEYEFDIVLERIKPELQNNKLTIDQIVEIADLNNENKVLKVIQWLLDHQKISKKGIYYYWLK
ncbi:MAG: RecQ family ATP-dependent DNA helicase [Bacteroidales bacterium]|nr:RecQ family ATP-dependent DNA helicase [Bacteroidales bacterium]